MVDRIKNVRNSLLSVAAVIASVEYFKIWTKDNYDVMHCYTRVNKVGQDSSVYKITSNGTSSCDTDAQLKQIHKKLNKLKPAPSTAEQPLTAATKLYCLNENLEADKVIDKVVGFYAENIDELKLSEYCQGAIHQLI